MESKTPPRSFNTVKNSNRETRAKRQKNARMLLLSILAVAALIGLIASAFLIWSIGDLLISPKPDNNDPAGNTPSAEITYTATTKSRADIHAGDLILVSEDRNLQYVFPAAPNLMLIEDIRQDQNGERPYQTRVLREDEKLLSDAAYAANRLLTDFYLQFGDNSLILMDSHRSQADQENSPSDTPVGFSEHHTGLVFNIRTYNKDNKVVPLSGNVASDWIYQNAHKYGIICRYPSDKETETGVSGYNYCFRYVGVAHATYMKQNNLCLEEYLDLLKASYSNGAMLDVVGDDGAAYKVYYVSASAEELTTVRIPQNYRYTISGDNSGGFIVTIFCNEPVA